ncbi:MAG: hypothetical protein A2042_01240 [Candidatus Schekmanbacteria bacterium GWA2_38_11]|uniref:Probable periplasmic serine endoprotease DegP-like n=1 Tax=Candidatus Schekmanbacteria bacterium GWA2_38_11 TaxID=1817876 RepID=A0A1F7RPQ8_9BACT|nr:MAG: hypothetical protein A2042_01240 [Candidatus Schekmanbacteria bacterium GWA2_38_11]
MAKKSVLFVIVLIAGLIGGIYLSSVFQLSQNTVFHGLLSKTAGKFWEEGKETVTPITPGGRPESFADLAEREKPAVVNISTTTVIKQRRGVHPFFGFEGPFGQGPQGPGQRDPFDDFFDRFFGNMPREYRQQSLGSGFIISKDGYIVTNNHVVDKADDIKVKLSNGKEYEAKVIGKDPKTDLALIKINASGLPMVVLGDSDKLRVGDWVVAIGNPFGLEETVTVGVVSAKGRVIGAGPYDDFIQTDASINPGNSGGPLFDINGNVVGINTLIIAQGQGIGFTIPINLAKEVLPQLKEKGKVRRAWLGVAVQDLTEDLAKSFNLKSAKGALVANVEKDGPAEKAGIKRGDVIVKFNGKEIENSHELSRKAASSEVGKKIDVVVIREGKEKTMEVTMGEYPSGGASFGEGETEEGEEGGKGEEADIGISVQQLTPDIAERLGAKGVKGVVISDVDPGNLAEEAGLRRGDIIKEVDRKPVDNMREFKKEMKETKLKKGILFLIQRGETTFFVTLKKE